MEGQRHPSDDAGIAVAGDSRSRLPVENLDQRAALGIAFHEDALRRQAAVDDLPAVCVGNHLGNLAQNIQTLVHGEGVAFLP